MVGWRAGEMGRDGGHAEITVDSTIYRADEPLRALLSGHDFAVGTTYHRMRVDHIEPAPNIPANAIGRNLIYPFGSVDF